MTTLADYGHGIYAFDSGYLRPMLAAVHLVVEKGRVAFIDTGTNDTLPTTLAALEALGLQSEAVDYVMLSHIHLDHAGGAGRMMAAFPNARLVVHPRGARHMIEPSRLIAGVTDVYGAEYVKKMYGEILPVPGERVIEAGDGAVIDLAGRLFTCIDTPGHARHHICIWDERSGGVFTGDMAGLCYRHMAIDGRDFVFPTTTPTQFEPTATKESLARLMAFQPTCFFLTHFGRVGDPARIRNDLERRVEAHVAIALTHRDAGDQRHERIKSDLTRYLVTEASGHGVVLDAAGLEWWEADLELNAQGLEAWLDGGAKQRG